MRKLRGGSCVLIPTCVCMVTFASRMQACINYADMLGHRLQHADLSAATVVHHVHIMERDALMCSALEQAASQQSGPVVGVVGADHLQGIRSLWAPESCAQYAVKQQQPQVDI